MFSGRTTIFLIATAAILPLLAVFALFWRRFDRDDQANNVRRVFKNSAVPFALRLFVRALDMVFFVILVRGLPADEYGIYAFAVLLVGQYLTTITEFGLGVLLTREATRDPGLAQRLFSVTLLLRWLILIVAAIPGAAVLIGGTNIAAQLGFGEAISAEGQQAIWILLLTLPFSAYSGAVTALYHAAERMEVPALMEVVTAVMGFIARLSVLSFGIIGISWASVGVTAITAFLFFLLQTRSFFVPTLQWDTRLAQELIPLAFPLMLNNLLNAVFFRFDTFIIKTFGGGDGNVLVGQYDTAYKIINIAMILPPVVTFAVFPMLARRASSDREGLLHAQNRTLQLLFLLGFPLAMGLSVLAPNMIALVSGERATEYLPISGDVLAILAWFLPLSFVNGLIQYVLIAVNRQHAITKAFVIGAVFNVVSNIIFIPQFGLYAASTITVLSEVVLLLVFLPMLRSEKLTPPLFALMWRPILSSLAMGVIMLIFQNAFGWWAAVLIAAPVYAVGLWLTGAIGPEEQALARRVLGRP